MRKKSTILILMLCATCAGLSVRMWKVENFSKQCLDQLNENSVIEESLALEERLLDAVIEDDYLLIDSRGNESSLSNILDSNSSQVVVFLTSLTNCSTCREKELDRWAQSYKSNTGLNIYLVVSEPVDNFGPNSNALRRAIASARGLVDFPSFIEPTGQLLRDLQVEPGMTPVVLILNKSRKILVANRPIIQREKRSEFFRRLVTMSYANSEY